MKTIQTMLIGILFMAYSFSVEAQVSVNVNIGTPPAWGPSGYTAVDYYYLPDIEAYYDVRATEFIFLGNSGWIRSRNLPNQYRNYNLYNGYKVVLNDYRGSTPYSNFKTHKTKYYKGYKGKPQKNIGVYKVNNSSSFKASKNYKSEPGNHGNDKKDKGNNGHGKGKN
jgi:hypothetical protein